MRDLCTLLVGASLTLVPAVSLASPVAAPTREAPVQKERVNSADRAPARPVDAARPSSSSQRTADDRQRYAARDEASPEAKNYRGGDTVVIGATAATAILAVLLLVILL